MARFEFSKIEKGGRFTFEKSFGLSKIGVGLGWDANPDKEGDDFDLDVSSFLLNSIGTFSNDFDFVYYNSANRTEPFDRTKFKSRRQWIAETRPMSSDGSLLGSLDDQDAEESEGGDNETVNIDLESVSDSIQEIVFVVTIHEAEKRNQNFGMVSNAYIRIFDEETEEELLRYDLKEQFGKENGLEVGKLLRNEDGDWVFEAIGNAYEGGINTFVDFYDLFSSK